MASDSQAGEIIFDRRDASRIPFETKVTVFTPGVVFNALTRDLTTSGAFVITDLLLPENAALDLEIALRDDHAPIAVSGRVIRVSCESPESTGFAVQFDSIEDDDARRIASGVGAS